MTVGILLANTLVVAVHKHRVLGGVADPVERARLRRTSLAQLAASVTMFGGAALYLLGGR